MSGINTGKQLEYEVSASLRNIYDRTEEFWFKRYPDHRDWIAINKKLRAPRAPADFIALCRGVFIAIEAKCFDSQTEILTKDGFKLFPNISYDDEIATLNQDTNKLEYQKPSIIYEYDYDGDMILFDGNFVNQLVTPNHRFYVKKTYKDDFEFIEARNIKRHHKFRKVCNWDGTTVDRVYIDTVTGPSNVVNVEYFDIDDFLILLGAYLAEGNIGDYPHKDDGYISYKVVISNDDYDWKLKLANIIKKYGFSPYIDKRRLTFSSKQLVLYFKQFGKARQKYIPTWVKNLPLEKLKILYDEMYFGDGRKNDRQKYYCTSSKKLADDVTEICLKMGMCTNIVIATDNKKYGDSYKVSVYKNDTVGICDDRSIKKQQYSGKVHCVEVPNHVIYVKRNGKSLWSGNSTKGPRFTFSWLKDHQLASLMDIEDAGGKSYILFSKRRGDQDDRKTPIQAWAIPIRAYERMEIALLNLKRPRKSAKIAEMAEIGIELIRLPGSMWDFTPLIEDALSSKQTVRGEANE